MVDELQEDGLYTSWKLFLCIDHIYKLIHKNKL